MYPQKSIAFSFDLSLVSRTGRPAFKSNPTLASGDVKISIDEGAFANIATLPTVTPTGGRNVKVSLSTSEMNGDRILVQFVDAAGAEWDDVLAVIDTIDGYLPTQTYGMQSNVMTAAALASDAVTEIQTGLATSSALSNVQSDTDDIQTRLPAALVGGRIDASVGAMASNVITAAAIATDAVTEIQSGLATSSALATVQADTDDIQARLPAVLVGGRMDASVGAMAVNVITAAAIAADAIGASELAADAVTEIQSGLATALALATVQADTDDIQTRLPAVLVGGRVDASVGAMAAGVVTAAAVATNAIDADALATDAVTEIQAGLATAAALAAAQTDLTTLTGRLTSARAGYLDNLNIGGPVASQADVFAINQSASRRVILTTVGQYERPDSGSVTYTVEARTYDGDGAAVNADSTPTLTATGSVSGSLAANLSAATNPSTGVYRWTYTAASSAVVEQIRYDVSATIGSSTFTLSAYTQVVDLVAATWTTTDATHLTGIFNKLPSKNYITGTDNSTGAVEASAMTGNFPGSVASVVAAVAITAGAVQSIWDALVSALTTVGSVGKRVVDFLDAAVTSRMATYTQPTGFLAATFPATVASPTNITAGTITTVGSVATNGITATSIAAGAIRENTFADDTAKYQADIKLTTSSASSADRYTVSWTKNNVPILTGVTDPTIQVVAPDGSDLIAETAMTEEASTGVFRYSETVDRIAGGDGFVAVVTATIDGATRIDRRPISRDV